MVVWLYTTNTRPCLITAPNPRSDLTIIRTLVQPAQPHIPAIKHPPVHDVRCAGSSRTSPDWWFASAEKYQSAGRRCMKSRPAARIGLMMTSWYKREVARVGQGCSTKPRSEKGSMLALWVGKHV
ncbi:hypothetical protein CC80DRAFT_54716 [Byssothecium circinans]|uniref:Uncharacterized protein n=1 Tax=Byssothecium circinans TaxID=147558 RepID=A0A6A5TXG2_9PLEO|nr:hypothetical protein CC80DRAFT_54716 [Byssothecium circinans]